MAKKCYAVMAPNQDWFICHKAKGRDYGMKGKEADMGVWSISLSTGMLCFIGEERTSFSLPKNEPSEGDFIVSLQRPSYEEASHYAHTIFKGRLVTVRKDARWEVRRNRLKFVFDGRCDQLEAVRGTNNSYGYGEAVRKYTRARTAWRNFRGWW